MKKVSLLSFLCLALSFSVFASQMKQVGNYTVHFSAFPSTTLTPEIATKYQIKRSKFTGIVNIVVLNQQNLPVNAMVNGTANDLLKRYSLDFMTIKEGNSIYYLAQVPILDNETLGFSIDLKHKNHLNTQLKFKQTFFVD